VIALRALGIGRGDDVVLPSYVCASVRDAIVSTGAKPVLCDLGSPWLMTAESVAPAITSRTRAIIAVSMFGLAADIDGIAAYGIPVIDDRCQAFGLPAHHAARAEYSVCSFHAIKCLTAGEGGAVLAWSEHASMRLNDELAVSRRTLGVLSDLQSVLAARQLERWPEMQQRRRAIAAAYLDALPAERTQALPVAGSEDSVWFRFPVLLRAAENFDALRESFGTEGIQVRRGVDALLHRQAQFPDSHFPRTVEAFDRTLSLPIWPAMSDEDVDHVIEVATRVLGR
jgi:UDP-4-amino-4-deoxy-L-arabinose-oxoglutarate aminotransferase